MWQWFLAGGLILANVATVLVVVVVVRRHLRPAVAPGRPDEVAGQGNPPMADLDARLAARAERLRRLLAAADERIAELRRLSEEPHAAGVAAPLADRRRSEILRLADEGVDPVGIARQVGMHVGEVELMLNLDRSAPMERA